MGSLPPTLRAAASTPLFVLLAVQLDRQAGLTAFHPPVLVSSEPLSPKGISISPPEDRLLSPSILTPHPLPLPIACHLRACRPHGTADTSDSLIAPGGRHSAAWAMMLEHSRSFPRVTAAWESLLPGLLLLAAVLAVNFCHAHVVSGPWSTASAPC